MGNVSDKSCRENQNTFYIHKRFPENCPICEIMWQNFVQPDRPQMKIWRMRIACCVPKAADTHSEYVILTAFPVQKRLDESASILRLYVHCQSCFK